jgi:hypothetical protein
VKLIIKISQNLPRCTFFFSRLALKTKPFSFAGCLPGSVTTTCAPASYAYYSQPFWAVGAKDKDALDIAGSAGTCDERNETRIVVAILCFEQGEGINQVG